MTGIESAENRQPSPNGRPKVAVVFGGRSSEHAISCVSASSVLQALDPDRYDVLPIGITLEGRWVLTSGDPDQLRIHDRKLPAVTDGAAVVLPGDPTTRGIVKLDARDGVGRLSGVDVVFPVLHGAFGEDGTIQGLLEMAGVPYVGAGVLASAVGMDKDFTKKLLIAAGLPVGDYVTVRRGETLRAEDRERLGLPVFVKPARAGSSIGVSKVNDWGELDAAIAVARDIDPKVLVEAAIEGREVECGVLEAIDLDGEPETSVPAEVRVIRGHDWYDFEAKYLDDACEYDLPAKLPDDVSFELRELAKQTFIALDCAGLARVDFFVTPENKIYVNEINTMPGFTPISLFSRMWDASGLPYPTLVSRLVDTALARGTGLR